MSKKPFNLAAMLGDDVQNGHAAEQIVRIPIELIEPDERNFYSLDGIGELAANIETVGLLDALRVRPNGGRYTVVSGHRRRAAILSIIDGGSDMFADGVPCIVEYGEATDAMRELRLIFANSNTRVMSAADLSKQAERTEAVLLELKKQGVEFKGRMREHVAEILRVSESKLARLHAIRSNLSEYALDAFDAGKINESVAYELSRLPGRLQQIFMIAWLRNPNSLNWLNAQCVDDFKRRNDTLHTMTCGANVSLKCGAASTLLEESERRKAGSKSFGSCNYGKCCVGCTHIDDCDAACQKASELKAQRAAEAERAAAAIKARQESAEAKSGNVWDPADLRQHEDVKAASAHYLKLAEAAGLDPAEKIPGQQFSLEQLRHIVASDSPSETVGMGIDTDDFTFWDVDDLVECATALKVTTDYLLGMSDTPQPLTATLESAGPHWNTGEPPEPGWYAVLSVWRGFENEPPGRECLHWHAGGWYTTPTAVKPDDATVLGWLALPDYDLKKEAEADD